MDVWKLANDFVEPYLTKTQKGKDLRREIWGPAMCGLMAPPLAIAHFDSAVAHGIPDAIELLQKAIDVKVDGLWGPITDAAFRRNNGIATALEILDARKAKESERVAALRSLLQKEFSKQYPTVKRVLHPVAYSSQRDNWDLYHGPGHRQCCLTSHYMAADYYLEGEIKKSAIAQGMWEGEDLYGKVLAQYGDTTNPDAHTPALRRFGIESYFTRTASLKDLLLCLDFGPVPMGVAYKADGHYMCGVGYNDTGVFAHEPNGPRVGYSDTHLNTDGSNQHFSWDWIQKKFLDLGSENGYIRVFTSIKGKSTGLPEGL